MYLYIVVIGWLYVVLLMAATEKTLTAAVLTFVGYGLVPIAAIVWVSLAGARRRRRSMTVGEVSQQPDRADTQRDQ
jgi:biotin transporter BioY